MLKIFVFLYDYIVWYCLWFWFNLNFIFIVIWDWEKVYRGGFIKWVLDIFNFLLFLFGIFCKLVKIELIVGISYDGLNLLWIEFWERVFLIFGVNRSLDFSLKLLLVLWLYWFKRFIVEV